MPDPDGREPATAAALFDRAPCGYLETDLDGYILAVNQTLLDWTGFGRDDLVGRRTFADLLTAGGRIYSETHYLPMLVMQGHARQIALDIVCADGRRLSTLVNAVVDLRDGDDAIVRTAVFDATDRRGYERELVAARKRAEASELHARRLAETLQRTLIPPALPTVAGLDVAAAYRPAGDGTEIGGDFYDVFQVGSDDWVAVIGDVEGKGVDAAIVTSLARHTVRAAAVAYERPSDIMRTLNHALLLHETSRICTGVVIRARRQAQGWLFTICVAGHPLPLLHDGVSVATIGQPGPLLGHFDDAAFTDTTVAVVAGQAVLLYTDGVSEARRNREWYGDDRIARILRSAPRTADDITRSLLHDVLTFESDNPRDDIAILTIHVPADG